MSSKEIVEEFLNKTDIELDDIQAMAKLLLEIYEKVCE